MQVRRLFFFSFLFFFLSSISVHVYANGPMSVLPFDVIFNTARYLDVCTLWALADTCRAYRHEFLESPSTWRRLVIDMKYCDVKLLYASLRRFRDTNGLRPYVKEVRRC